MSDERAVIPGSEREPAAAATPGPALDPSAEATVTVVLRRATELPAAVQESGHILGRDELAAHGASIDDVNLVTHAVQSAGLVVASSDPASRRLQVRGSLGALSDFFGTSLSLVTTPALSGEGDVTHRHRTGSLSVPRALDGVIVAVLGLDDRQQARTWFRPAAAKQVSYTPPELGSIYRFPAGTDGSGQTIAIIELGGGFGTSDLSTYFGGLKIPVPQVKAVGVDGAANEPGKDPSGADGEVLLDIEVAGALAPKATFLVYFAPNTDQGFVDAIADAAHASPTPTAISISWGGIESSWTAQARKALDEACADAVALGVTVTAAAGDNGSSDSTSGGSAVHVDFPASSPHVLACGGTALTASASGAVTSETVWNDPGHGATGGGVSIDFAVPVWQKSVGVPAVHGGKKHGRGVPDVAGVADPATGYAVLVDGTAAVYGGTSAVAPLWAALVARLAQKLGGPLGLLQPKLYAGVAAGAVAPGFWDITSGSNGAYEAAAGWDPCTGLGVPDGEALAARLAAAP